MPGAALALLSFVAIATFWPWRVAGRYAGYRGCHDDFLEMSESGRLGRALVLVKATPEGEGDAVSALSVNDAIRQWMNEMMAADRDEFLVVHRAPDNRAQVICAW